MTKARSDDRFKAGDLLNNTYRIEALLGRGGTSDVYRARSEISDRLVAIKALFGKSADTGWPSLSGDGLYRRHRP
jgi:serine/threonine protein kinase